MSFSDWNQSNFVTTSKWNFKLKKKEEEHQQQQPTSKQKQANKNNDKMTVLVIWEIKNWCSDGMEKRLGRWQVI